MSEKQKRPGQEEPDAAPPGPKREPKFTVTGPLRGWSDIFMSNNKPIDVIKTRKPVDPNGASASISTGGVIGVYIETQDGGRNVHFVDTRRGRTVSFAIENWTQVVFHKETAFFLTRKYQIRCMGIERIFAEAPAEAFEVLPTAECYSYCDASYVEMTGAIVYGDVDDTAYYYKIQSKENLVLDLPFNFLFQVPLSGVRIPGIQSIYKDMDGILHIIDAGNNVIPWLNAGKGNTLVIPSQLDPTNLTKAIVITPKETYINGKVNKTCGRFKFLNTFVRLHDDIFLHYDGRNKTWAICRIVVP